MHKLVRPSARGPRPNKASQVGCRDSSQPGVRDPRLGYDYHHLTGPVPDVRRSPGLLKRTSGLSAVALDLCRAVKSQTHQSIRESDVSLGEPNRSAEPYAHAYRVPNSHYFHFRSL